MTRQQPLGLFFINRPEWVIAEQASYYYSYTTVPLYDTLGIDAIEFIVNQTEMKYIVLTLDKSKTIAQLLPKLPTVRHLVLVDGSAEAAEALALETKLTVTTFQRVEKQGAQAISVPEPTLATDIATICYTSGTTGTPKGVVLTHHNMLSEVAAIQFLADTGAFSEITRNDVHLSYLPLAHVLERVIETYLTSKGAKIAFYQGDTLKLLDDVAELKPTIFVSVPRLFNRIYDKVWAGVSAKGGISEMLFRKAYNTKKANLAKGQVDHWFWDRIVFNTVRSRLGGRVRMMLTGSAPISPEVMDFLRICFSATVYEGYGQTETTAGLTLTDKCDTDSGHVGIAFPCCELKLVDVPSMEYFVNDKFPRGEIVVRGESVFREYYKSPEKTIETLRDGWCYTGDIGEMDSRGRLRVIDRVKNIFKLAQGGSLHRKRSRASTRSTRSLHRPLFTVTHCRQHLLQLLCRTRRR